jgi:leucyl-tRNA synthetase
MSDQRGTRWSSRVREYDFGAVEAKWQAQWAEAGCFKATAGATGEKFFNFDGGPFPNGPLHMGHVRTFTLGDVMARYQRMRGRRVLYCFEFDAFGLPNELAAEAIGVAPEVLTRANIDRMRTQMVRLGLSYDWRHVTVTCDPAYYRWTQWLFLKLHERGLAYRTAAELNWCPSCQTTLAHMQVEDGRCWRCETVVEQRMLIQWFIALSRYSSALAEGLERVEGFSPRVRNVLRGFLGATRGREIEFELVDHPGTKLRAFLAECDTVARPAYLAVAPGHPDLAVVLSQTQGSTAVIGEGMRLTARHRRRGPARTEDPLDGLNTGHIARDPESGMTLPVFLARYVDLSYARGVEIGCPNISARDRQFAERHGIMIAGAELATPLRGRPVTHYRVRDWLVSRQRAWGTPIPIIHCATCGEVAVPEEALPVVVPKTVGDARPGGLAALPGFAEADCPRCGKPARRETDTLDCYFDVIWCFLACAGKLDEGFAFQPSDFAEWMPVDWFHNGLDSFFYVHLYRFIGHVLHEMGILSDPEPIRRYVGHDAILQGGRKMSKHHGNVVSPDELLEAVGADTLRVQVLWAANPLKSVEWSDSGLLRAQRLMVEAWALVLQSEKFGSGGAGDRVVTAGAQPSALDRVVSRSIRRITSFLEHYQYSGCLQELQNLLQRLSLEVERLGKSRDQGQPRESIVNGIRCFVLLLSPFAPHMAEEMWQRLGGPGLVATACWPDIPIGQAPSGEVWRDQRRASM